MTQAAISSYEARPTLAVIPGEGMGMSGSREAFEDYFQLRIAAGYADKPEGEELATIQEDVRTWLTTHHPDLNDPGSVGDYRTYNLDEVNKKIGGLVDFLDRNYGDKISEVEREATRAFITSTFAMYEDKERAGSLTDRDGSFAFVVPARMSRKYPMYGQEVEPVIPALRYVPNELRAWIMRGCPPFVIDTYKPDNQGKRGYLVYAPVTEDMRSDLSVGDFVRSGQEAVNDAVDFAADRLGVKVVGLGAVLPAITRYGQSIRREDIITTTGHGGTVELICATIDSLTEGRPVSVGVLGLGAIGAAAAEIAAETYEGRINIFDTVRKKVSNLVDQYPGRFTESGGIAELISESEVVISAITDLLDLNALGIGDMSGKLVVDDSQPGSMRPGQVKQRGGRLVWPLGQDMNERTQRIGYDYGTMKSGTKDLFGCEAEAAVLANYLRDLVEERGLSPEQAFRIIGRIAITGPVTKESASRIGRLFKHYGIIPADPQAFGRAA